MKEALAKAACILVAGILAGALIVAITLAGIVFVNHTQLIHLNLEMVPEKEQQKL